MDMEWLELFDINENCLNKKILRGITPNINEYVMIVYIFIKNSEGKYLLEKNSATEKWVVPGGHVNEVNPINSIKRECMEELGLNIEVNNLQSIETLSNNNRLFKLYYLELDLDINNIVVQKEEVKEVGFFSIDEIDNMIEDGSFRKNNIIFIDCLKKYKGVKYEK